MERELSSGRLQSLRLPRDLTLGIQKPKKQYVPNLNVVRKKDKAKEVIEKLDEKRKDKPTLKTKHSKNEGKQQRFTQSTGIFSQGVAEVKRHSSYSEKRGSFREGGSSSKMPIINRNSCNDKKSDAALLDEDSDSDYDVEDEKMSFAPLTITQFTKQIKDELVVKTEEGIVKLPPPFEVDSYTEENPYLAMVHLPPSFAGKRFCEEHQPSCKPDCKKLIPYPLSHMLEGQIGKLIIRKSGTIQMQIGSMKYNLEKVNTFDGREELATVTKGDNDEGSIAVLGHVTDTYCMTPVFDSLLEKK